MSTETPQPALGSVTPYLAIEGAAAAIEFYAKVFGAVEIPGRLTMPDGKIAHAEIKIGDAVVMLADSNPQYHHDPLKLGGSAVVFNVIVDDVDATIAKAVEEGATVLIGASDQFYGMRSGRIRDPFGHLWIVSKWVEEVSIEEMVRRFDKMIGD